LPTRRSSDLSQLRSHVDQGSDLPVETRKRCRRVVFCFGKPSPPIEKAPDEFAGCLPSALTSSGWWCSPCRTRHRSASHTPRRDWRAARTAALQRSCHRRDERATLLSFLTRCGPAGRGLGGLITSRARLLVGLSSPSGARTPRPCRPPALAVLPLVALELRVSGGCAATASGQRMRPDTLDAAIRWAAPLRV